MFRDYLSVEKGSINEREFVDYQNNLLKFEFPIHNCMILSPIFDLIDYSILENRKGQNFALSPVDGKALDLVVHSNVTVSTVLSREIDERMSDDRFLLDYGIIKEENPHHYMQVNVDFDMNQLGNKKMAICLNYKCEGLDLLRFSPKMPSIRHEFYLKENQINLGLLNIAKLFVLPDDDLDVEFHSISFAARKTLGTKTELKGMTKYFEFLAKEEPEGLSYFDVLKNNPRSKEDPVENKLWQIGLRNYRILFDHYDKGLDHMYKILMNDLKEKKISLVSE